MTTKKERRTMIDPDDLFAGQPAPSDIVRGPGVTREQLKRMNDHVGTIVQVTVPGDVTLDLDGVPAGVGPPTTEGSYFGGVTISQGDVHRLGLTAEELERDFPNVRVLPDPKEGNQ